MAWNNIAWKADAVQKTKPFCKGMLAAPRSDAGRCPSRGWRHVMIRVPHATREEGTLGAHVHPGLVADGGRAEGDHPDIRLHPLQRRPQAADGRDARAQGVPRADDLRRGPPVRQAHQHRPASTRKGSEHAMRFLAFQNSMVTVLLDFKTATAGVVLRTPVYPVPSLHQRVFSNS